MEFRAKVIHDFIVKAREKVKSVNNNIKFGVYVGAWYSTYYTSGVNWASPKYNTSAYYPKWATSDYKNYGYAGPFGLYLFGCLCFREQYIWKWRMDHGRFFVRMDVNCYKEMLPFAGGPDIGTSTGWTDGGQSAKIRDTIYALYQ